MNFFDIQKAAFQAGLLGLDDSESKKVAFLSTFANIIEHESDDELGFKRPNLLDDLGD